MLAASPAFGVVGWDDEIIADVADSTTTTSSRNNRKVKRCFIVRAVTIARVY
jgi:hypothetical protein